jgi:hypothetical protein
VSTLAVRKGELLIVGKVSSTLPSKFTAGSAGIGWFYFEVSDRTVRPDWQRQQRSGIGAWRITRPLLDS